LALWHPGTIEWVAMNWLFKEEPEHYSFDALAKAA
jgi:hypothetical protein